jgi:hypothetical protein
MAAEDWATIKVPRVAYEEALRMKNLLLRKGTGILPPQLRPDGPFTIGHVFTLGVNALHKVLKPGIRKGDSK